MRSTRASLLLLLLFLGSTGAALAQRGDYSITRISPEVVRTPDFGMSDKRTPDPGRWLEVEVQFQARPVSTDELQFKYYILFAGKLLAGDVTHVDVPAGRELYSVVYVSPRTIMRLLDNRPLTGAEVQNVGVQILNKGQVVAEKSFKFAQNREWWQTMQQTTGMVLNKSETPFAPLYWDRYEALKPAH